MIDNALIYNGRPSIAPVALVPVAGRREPEAQLDWERAQERLFYLGFVQRVHLVAKADLVVIPIQGSL